MNGHREVFMSEVKQEKKETAGHKMAREGSKK